MERQCNEPHKHTCDVQQRPAKEPYTTRVLCLWRNNAACARRKARTLLSEEGLIVHCMHIAPLYRIIINVTVLGVYTKSTVANQHLIREHIRRDIRSKNGICCRTQLLRFNRPAAFVGVSGVCANIFCGCEQELWNCFCLCNTKMDLCLQPDKKMNVYFYTRKSD